MDPALEFMINNNFEDLGYTDELDEESKLVTRNICFKISGVLYKHKIILNDVKNIFKFPKINNNIKNIVELNDIKNEKIYYKQPDPLFDDSIDNMIVEINAYENVPENINIMKYYGTLINNENCIIGICLEKCNPLFPDWTPEDNIEITEEIYNVVENAIKHIHKSGYVHGDINPMNIFIRENGKFILGDLDLCLKVGEKRNKWGMLEWSDYEFVNAKYEHDLQSLEKLKKYIKQ
jgi:serine/threonine protein kinase